MTALPGPFPCTGVGSLPHLDPRAAVAEVLLALELEGRLERHRGNRVSLM